MPGVGVCARAWALSLVAIAAGLAAASVARAQALVQDGEDGVSFALDSVAAPIVEPGLLTFYARDLGANAPRMLRVDARGVRVEPGAAAASVVACRGTRWLLDYADRGNRGRWSLRAHGAAELWSREGAVADFAMVTLGCSGAAPVVGWLERGELVTLTPGASPSATPAVTSVRVLPATERGDVEWRRAPSGEIFAAVRAWSPRPAELLRIASGVVTHRASLGMASDIRVALSPSADRVLVARHLAPDAHLSFASFAATDLAPGPESPLPVATPGERRRTVTCAWLAPGRSGRVVLALVESWEDGWVAIAQGPNEPDRHEPAHHSAVMLRVWEPRTGRIGPALALGSRYAGAGAWLGDRFVLVTPVEPDGVVGGIVQLRAARIRRFSVRAP